MLLKKITLNDFGTYGGRNEFDFAVSEDRPIILCGGRNGAGKTTLFESIMLCLYGQRSFAQKISQKQYSEIILKSFHRYAGTKKSAEEASIVVEFQYAHDGAITQYQVIRMWQNNSGKIQETLTVRKKTPTDSDYANLDSIEESEWQLFIDQLLPKGITNLFFFDGEKIQSIADSGDEGEHIRSSFDTLLGLDLVKQLHDDMGLYMLRDSDGETRKILDDIEQKTQEKQEAEKKIDTYHEKQTYLKAEINGLQRQLDVQEEQFSKLGGMFAQKREELMIQKTKTEAGLESMEKQIRNICADTLPFTIIPQEMKELKEEIGMDQKRIEGSFAKNILGKNFDGILESTDLCTKDADTLKEVFAQRLHSIPNADDTLFNFSTNDMNDIIQLIDKIQDIGISQIEKYSKEHSEAIKSLKDIQSALDVSPKQDEIGPVFSELKKTSRHIGELEAELNHLTELESQEKSMIVILNSKIRQNLAKRTMDSRRLAGLELGPKIQDALDEYAMQLRGKKIELLEGYILEGIKRLFHKKNFIEKISINRETFEVKLYKKNDDEITKDVLSSGELQMYATAIVWGLAKTSDRPLPFIIDTPLARLDVEHRDKLVDNFYPSASHQTIILSTNSEITTSYYRKLEPYISKSMTIQYDPERGKTEINDRYFGGDIVEDIRN